jgi:hypothetical protein
MATIRTKAKAKIRMTKTSNVSRNSAPVGGLLAVDFDLNPRIQVGRVDRGAFELSEVLLSNGFQ